VEESIQKESKMAFSFESQHAFPHRMNPDGTVDSICPNCFMTIATAANESDLGRLEAFHRCDPKSWRPLRPNWDYPTRDDHSNWEDPPRHTLPYSNQVSRSIH